MKENENANLSKKQNSITMRNIFFVLHQLYCDYTFSSLTKFWDTIFPIKCSLTPMCSILLRKCMADWLSKYTTPPSFKTHRFK